MPPTSAHIPGSACGVHEQDSPRDLRRRGRARMASVLATVRFLVFRWVLKMLRLGPNGEDKDLEIACCSTTSWRSCNARCPLTPLSRP